MIIEISNPRITKGKSYEMWTWWFSEDTVRHNKSQAFNTNVEAVAQYRTEMINLFTSNLDYLFSLYRDANVDKLAIQEQAYGKCIQFLTWAIDNKQNKFLEVYKQFSENISTFWQMATFLPNTHPHRATIEGFMKTMKKHADSEIKAITEIDLKV